MTDEQLKTMTKDEANKTLSYEDKVRWAELQNSTANLRESARIVRFVK